jgi:iron complex transport system substrate-binding protein
MAGRQVSLPGAPKRIILLEAHDLLTMSLLHPDAASIVAGWAAIDRIDSPALIKSLSNGHQITVVGKQTPDSVSLEQLISLAPDLVVTTAFMSPQGGADPIVSRLNDLKIPVVYSDISSNALTDSQNTDPVTLVKAYMRMWGKILGVPQKAEAFLSVVEDGLASVTTRVSKAPRVTTYLEVQSTPDDCCWAAGRKVWGELLALAGGQPLPGVKAPYFEKLSLEYVLTTPHDVYIASGGGWAAGNRPAIGPGLDREAARESLEKLVESRSGFAQLPSAVNKRVYGIWTGLISNLPLNVVFVVLTAKWLHPELCSDLEPEAILTKINTEFAAFAIEGPLWVSL